MSLYFYVFFFCSESSTTPRIIAFDVIKTIQKHNTITNLVQCTRGSQTDGNRLKESTYSLGRTLYVKRTSGHTSAINNVFRFLKMMILIDLFFTARKCTQKTQFSIPRSIFNSMPGL